MALDFLRQGDCSFYGPALPEPYVRFELEKALAKHKLLPDTEGLAGETLHEQWEIFRRKLRDVSPNSGPVAITNRILEPLVSRLGYTKLTAADTVLTREGDEAGGVLMSTDTGAKLRCWAIDYDADLDAPTQRGYAYRFSPVRIAQRVLLATGERVGLITNGVGLRLLLCDPARPESHIEIDLNVWRLSRDLPDGYQLLLALAGPAGIVALPEIIEDARLKQNKVTKELRNQAREAIKEFVQAVLDHPDNAAALTRNIDKSALSEVLWHEGLIVVYRLLFILKCESTNDSSRLFRFASTPLWQKTYSPKTALARTVRRVLDEGATSGRYLEDGLRVLFKLFADGLEHPGLTVRPLGGALFGAQSTPLLSSLRWGELAVAHLLDRLLWSDTRRGRERVHYGPLDVEDLGRVYEALLELEPGIATEPMCRLKRQKLEVVVPAAQGEKYRATAPARSQAIDEADDGDEDQGDEEEAAEDEKPTRGKKTKVEWIEAIAPGRFYLRVGLGRKSSGSYYTPHSFVRFLVQETLGPQCDQRSPRDNPDPGAILKLKVLDPACGSGHFLVEACRFLAGRAYEAARLCDELASKAEHDAEAEKNAARKQGLLERAAELRQRLRDLPDQEDELLSYLPSRSAGADKAVLSAHDIARAEAICRRLVAVHCIYGVDINPLAVELAKLSLWIESHAEGFPLTFLDHRIVVGNSLTGPFWEKLMFAPGSQQPVSDLFRQNLDLKLAARLREALTLVRQLEASVGVDVEDIAAKEKLKREIDARLQPFRVLAAAWSGGVMLGTEQPKGAPRCDDAAYSELLEHVGNTGELPARMDSPNLEAMIDNGRLALPYDLTFPEVFHPTGLPHGRYGFDAVVGNPPWDQQEVSEPEFWGSLDFGVLDADTPDKRIAAQERLRQNPQYAQLWDQYVAHQESMGRVTRLGFEWQVVEVAGKATSGKPDAFRLFAERCVQILTVRGRIGAVFPSAFYANEGVTGIRRLYLAKTEMRHLLGFGNARGLFEIHRSFKFLPVCAARSDSGTQQMCVMFGLEDPAILFDGNPLSKTIQLSRDEIAAIGGDYLIVPEVNSQAALSLLAQAAKHSAKVGAVCRNAGIDLRQGFSTTRDRHRRITVGQTAELPFACVVHEGKTVIDYSDRTEISIREAIPYESLPQSAHWRRSVAFFRVAQRRIARSTDTKTSILLMLPPLTVCLESLRVEATPNRRPTSVALRYLGVANSFPFDFLSRLLISAAAASEFVVDLIPVPEPERLCSAVAHGVLRLTCNHAAYEPLWREQLGNTWREPGKAPFTWPVLAGDDERWAVRAAIDAVVADAYGLSREQYAHVLSTFSHANYKKAPALCQAAFDELKAIGLGAFCKKHDPYHDIPLVETLPKPVIDLPIPTEGDGPSRGRRRKNRPQRADQPHLWDRKPGEPKPPATPAVPDAGKLMAAKTLVKLGKAVTSAEIQQKLGVDAAAAKTILKALVQQGLATAEGRGKGTRYRWVGK